MPRRKIINKKNENEESQKAKEENEENKKSNLSWIAIAILILAVVFIVFYYVFQDWGIVKYQGLKFTMEKYGKDLIVYHYEYYFKGPDNQVYKNNVYLRHDPRKNSAPVNGEIVFSNVQPAYISVNSEQLKSCEDSVIAVATLSQFLAHNLFNVKGATPNEKEATERNVTFVNCTTYPEHTTILLQAGEKTSITKEKNCYIVNVSNCEIQQAVERFIVQALIDAKKRYSS